MSKEELEGLISKYFTYTPTHEDENILEYLVEVLPDLTLDEAFSRIYDELVPRGYSVIMFSSKGMNFLRVSKKAVEFKKPLTQFLVLFLVTVASVAVTGYFTISNFNSIAEELNNRFSAGVPLIEPLIGTLSFLVSVLAPLMCHELGHYVVSRRAGIPVTYPLPIPAPLISPIGTFGAFIRSHHPPKDLKRLALVGVSGPLAGVTLSATLYIFSYLTSPRIPQEIALSALKADLISEIRVIPLITLFIDSLVGTKEVVLLNPIAMAAWFLLLVHFANLLPIGQLDGGHVVRSLTNVKTHSILSHMIIAVSILISFIQPNLLWLGIFSVLAWLISGRNPHYGVANLNSRLELRDKWFFSFLYAFLLLLTLPVVA
ncbi:MAG: site-2 protease family protein [Zestosphaera sp.]